MIDVRLCHESIPLEQLIAKAGAAEHGAQILFTGAVRNHNEGKPVTAVTYEAFEPLALKSLQEISEEAASEFGQDMTIQVWHRLGRLEIGELSVAILVTSRHRDASYRASRHIIEEMKKRTPIWKHEHYVEGGSEWLRGSALTEVATATSTSTGTLPSAETP